MPRFPPSDASIKTARATFRFYLGDCLDVLAGLPQGSVDVIVTSPPYNLGIQYRSCSDTIPRGEYLDWTVNGFGGRRPRWHRTARCF